MSSVDCDCKCNCETFECTSFHSHESVGAYLINDNEETKKVNSDQGNNNILKEMPELDNQVGLFKCTYIPYKSDSECLSTPQESTPESPKIDVYHNNGKSDEGNISDAAEVTTSLSISLASSQLSEEDLHAIGDLELESDIGNEDRSGLALSSNKILKHDEIVSEENPKKSNTYLEDYLQLLTTRSHSARLHSTEKGKAINALKQICDRRCSVPSLQQKTESHKIGRKRNLSGSSEGHIRSLGSAYLDSYLSNLTEHAWIIYPTETSKDCKKPMVEERPVRPITSPLHRRLHFIDPDKFFQPNSPSQKTSDSDNYSGSLSLPSNNSGHKELHCTRSQANSIDGTTSPDISSSIFDREVENDSPPKSSILDSGNVSQEYIESSSIYEENTIKEGYDLSEVSEYSQTTSGVTSMPLDEVNPISTSANYSEDKLPDSSLKDNPNEKQDPRTQFDKKDVKEKSSIKNNAESSSNVPAFLIGGKVRKECELDEEHSSSSEVSSATEPSTIVLIEDQTQHISDVDVSSLSSEIEKVSHSVDEKKVNFSEMVECYEHIDEDERKILNETFEIEIENVENRDAVHNIEERIICGDPSETLIRMLKLKHQKEMEELRMRQEEEMRQFTYQLKQFSTLELSSLVESYKSEGWSILSPYMKIEQTTSETQTSCHCSPVGSYYQMKGISGNVSTGSSFFLHEENSENDPLKFDKPNRTEQQVISRLFSPKNPFQSSSPKSITQLLNEKDTRLQDSKCTSKQRVNFQIPSSPINNSNFQLESKNYSFYTKTTPMNKFEADLNCVSACGDDCFSLSRNQVLDSSVIKGLCRFQAFIKGRRIRQMMRTQEVQKLLNTLTEVSKLAHEFHRDILRDNINKGDIVFHKALFQEEQQARDKFWRLLVESSPSEQIKAIHNDRTARKKVQTRRLAAQNKKGNSLPIMRSQTSAQVYSSPAKIVTQCKPIARIAANQRNKITIGSSSLSQSKELKSIPQRICSEPPRLGRSISVMNRKEPIKKTSPPSRICQIPSPKVSPSGKSRSPLSKNVVNVPRKVDSHVITINKGNNGPFSKTQVLIEPRVAHNTNNVNAPQWKSVGRSSIPRKPWR